MTHAALGRRLKRDPRDEEYPLSALLPRRSSRRTRYWNDSRYWGNQRSTPQCVAYAWLHWLEDGPLHPSGRRVPAIRPAQLYREAQQADEFPGEDYEGSSVRGGAKALAARGLIHSYHWAHGVDDVVLGINWYDGMFTTDARGFVQVRGPLAGGHAIECNGVSLDGRFLRLKNCCGRLWGDQGRARLRFADLERLLAEEGEACLAVEARP